MIALKKSNNCQKTSGFAAVRPMRIALHHFTYAKAGIGGLCIVTPDVVTRIYVKGLGLKRMSCSLTKFINLALSSTLNWKRP